MAKQAIIYIPDISGFTKFVTHTEVRHSEHIISELIDIILKSNEINLIVSEIEGDAVLFYKTGDPPILEDVLNQSKKMFVNFHKYLNEIERSNVCQCGACRTASDLTLKFITHFGELSEIQIQKFNKIMGSDVILAHRLLKNRINSREYLLLTESYLDTQTLPSMIEKKEISLSESVENIESFGEIKTKYVDFNFLRSEISKPVKSTKINEYRQPDFSIEINAPILLVHGVLIDAETKKEWIPEIKEVKNAPEINRINSSHTCVFENLELHLVTEGSERKNNKLYYQERGELDSGIKFIADYKLAEKNGNTVVSVSIFPALNQRKGIEIKENIIKKIKNKLIFNRLKKSIGKSLPGLKNYCEKLSQENNSLTP